MVKTPQLETKTKSRTSQITGVISAIVAAVGIGALIYFAAVGYQNKVTIESTQPLLDQEYPVTVEPAQATTAFSIQKLTSDITTNVDKTAQETGKTTQEVLKNTLVLQAANDNVLKVTKSISDKSTNLVNDGTIASYNTDAFTTEVLQLTLKDLNYSTTQSLDLQYKPTNAEQDQVKQLAQQVANQSNQLNSAVATDISNATNVDQATVNKEVTVQFTKSLNNTFELYTNQYNYSVATSKESNMADNQALSSDSGQPAAQNFFACTKDNTCSKPYVDKAECELSYGSGNCESAGCAEQGNPCGSALPVTAKCVTCQDNSCAVRNTDDPSKCIDSMELCSSSCGQNSQPSVTRTFCENQSCVEKQVPTDQVCDASNNCFESLDLCNASNCEPKQTYYFCDSNSGCLKRDFANVDECNATSSNGKCYLATDAGSSDSCDANCNTTGLLTFSYCSNLACHQVQSTDQGTCSLDNNSFCFSDGCTCKATEIRPDPRPYYYCDKNDTSNGCKQTDIAYTNISDCEHVYGVGNCLDGKKNVCDATCQPATTPETITTPVVTQVPEQNIAIASRITYRGLGRVIIRFWPDPNNLNAYEYTKNKLATDFQNNNLRLNFGDNNNNLKDILKVYKDPRSINGYYAIAYKLNIDDLWQKDNGIYKSKKYVYQVKSSDKFSDFFNFQSLQRSGEVMYVKNRLYNATYDLLKYGTVNLNIKNQGNVAAGDRRLNDKIRSFENGGVYFWIQSSKVSPYGLRTAMAGDQRYKQFYSILKNLDQKNDLNKAVEVLYNYHDRLIPTNIYSRYDIDGVKYWVKQVTKGKLSFNSMVTYVLLGTDEPRVNLEQFWGTGKIGIRKADIELSFVKSLSRGITQMSDIDRFMNPSKYYSTASIRGDLRNSDEFRRLLQSVYRQNGASSAVSLLYIADLGRPVDPDGQPFYLDKFNKLKSSGLNAMDALNEIDQELTSSKEYKTDLNKKIQ